jgi:hypothetical protein
VFHVESFYFGIAGCDSFLPRAHRLFDLVETRVSHVSAPRLRYVWEGNRNLVKENRWLWLHGGQGGFARP